MLSKACKGDERCICINNAVFKHDSGWATANNPNGTPSVGKRALNPGNMRPPKKWTPSVSFTVMHVPGNGQFAKFETLEDGVQANVELYFRHYAHYTNANDFVSVWADGGGKGSYRAAVQSCF